MYLKVTIIHYQERFESRVGSSSNIPIIVIESTIDIPITCLTSLPTTTSIFAANLMDSPQSVVSPFKGSSVSAEPEKQSSDFFIKNPGGLSRGVSAHGEEAAVCNLEDFIGVLDVYIYQARDIHNICIYHKQDVYAKICLTSDPENALSTQIVNGGGKSPVFNENLRLKVRTIECSVKCEIWMMSRVRNYMEDQLLGFAVVPLAEVLVKNGKLEKEFSLSSTDLFHSPAGYVQLSLSYNGTLPDVIAIPALPESVGTHASLQESKAAESLPDEFENIEFPDPKIVNENHLMVSEYFSIQCTNLDFQSSDSLVSSDTGNHLRPEVEVRVEERFPTGITNPNNYPKRDSPPSSVSTIESTSVSNPASSQSSDPSGESKSPNQEFASASKECATEKKINCGDAESNSSETKPGNAFPKPLVKVDIELEQKLVQQDIVDMYMKSMQQFTESLAKMKLPLDIGNGPTSSGSSSSDQKLETPKSTGSRVFYGSRAFF